MSIYRLGVPINGFRTSTQDTTEQYDDVGQWLWDTFDDFLKNADFGDVEVYFSDSERGMYVPLLYLQMNPRFCHHFSP